MQTVDFSIVIPAYNNLSLLQRTLESIRIQRGISMQIVVVDDSNRNNDIQDYIVGLADKRIQYQRNTPSLGAVRNWNEGFRRCCGRYIMLIHHDEALQEKNHLGRLKKELETTEIVISNIMVKRQDGHSYNLFPSWFKRLTLHLPSLLFFVNAIGPCAVVAFHKEHLQMFDEQLRWFVDVEWYYRMINSSTTSFLPSAVVTSHHGHQEQISQNININTEAKNDLMILYRKYGYFSAICIAAWIQVNILHNNYLHKLLKKIKGR